MVWVGFEGVCKNQCGSPMVCQSVKYQHFMDFSYQVGSWDSSQRCIAKLESTGKRLNVHYIVSNLPDKTFREIFLRWRATRGGQREPNQRGQNHVLLRPAVQPQLLGQFPTSANQLPGLRTIHAAQICYPVGNAKGGPHLADQHHTNSAAKSRCHNPHH